MSSIPSAIDQKIKEEIRQLINESIEPNEDIDNTLRIYNENFSSDNPAQLIVFLRPKFKSEVVKKDIETYKRAALAAIHELSIERQTAAQTAETELLQHVRREFAAFAALKNNAEKPLNQRELELNDRLKSLDHALQAEIVPTLYIRSFRKIFEKYGPNYFDKNRDQILQMYKNEIIAHAKMTLLAYVKEHQYGFYQGKPLIEIFLQLEEKIKQNPDFFPNFSQGTGLKTIRELIEEQAALDVEKSQQHETSLPKPEQQAQPKQITIGHKPQMQQKHTPHLTEDDLTFLKRKFNEKRSFVIENMELWGNATEDDTKYLLDFFETLFDKNIERNADNILKNNPIQIKNALMIIIINETALRLVPSSQQSDQQQLRETQAREDAIAARERAAAETRARAAPTVVDQKLQSEAPTEGGGKKLTK